MPKGHTNNPDGRPRKLEDPSSFTFRMESKDRARWESIARSRNQSLTDFLIECANEKTALHFTENQKADKKADIKRAEFYTPTTYKT